MSDGLKDCPFCGGGAVVSGDMSVHCAATCEACGATVDATSVTDAVSKWNRRADLAQAPAPVRARDVEIARLAREIGEIGRDLGWHRVYDRADAIRAALQAPDAGVVAELVDALRLADAALSGANMNMAVVEKKVKAALALIAHNTTEG